MAQSKDVEATQLAKAICVPLACEKDALQTPQQDQGMGHTHWGLCLEPLLTIRAPLPDGVFLRGLTKEHLWVDAAGPATLQPRST